MDKTKQPFGQNCPKRGAKYISLIFFFVVCTLIPGEMDAQIKGAVDRVKSHIMADPLSISGSLGSSLTASWNNADLHNTAPFSFTAYGNFNINIYGFSIPININFLDIRATQYSLPSRPTFTFNTTPTWKKFTFYLGTGSMNYSNYTYNGISFTGVGLEYNGKGLRFGGFYGTFNRSTTFQTELDNRSAIQFLADSLLGLNNVNYTTQPQFTRRAYAGHIGLGSRRNNIDFSFLRAADDINSLPDEWYLYELAAASSTDTTHVYRDSVIKAKENLCAGVKCNIAFGRWFTMNANIGASIYTPDITADTIEIPDRLKNNNMIRRGYELASEYNLFKLRSGTEVRMAGDAMMHLQIKSVGATFTYRFVQPNYTSLGANGFNQNAETYGGNIVLPLFKNHANFSATGYLQKDNLDGKQKYTNQVATYSASWSSTIGSHLSLNASYNGVKQDQMDGTVEVLDSLCINQITHTLNATPTLSFRTNDNEHGISFSFNLMQNRNLNKKMKGSAFDVTTMSAGVGYNIHITSLRLGINANYDYSQSRSQANNYNSHAITGGTSYNFISTESMKLSGNASATMAYNMQQDPETSITDAEKEAAFYCSRLSNTAKVTKFGTDNFSISMRLGASFTYKQAHNASLFFSVSNYSDNIIFGQHIATSTDVRVSVQYSYSFASRLIKKRNKVKPELASEK